MRCPRRDRFKGRTLYAGHSPITNLSSPNSCLAFSWRTTLSANLFNTSPRVSFPGLYADMTFTLLTYAYAISNLARSIVLSLGTYEHDRAISDQARKLKDDQLNVAHGFLCKASAIFSYVCDTVLLDWETNRAGGPPRFNKPSDLSREVINALAK